MKKFKKIASLLLALVMVCAMSVTALAADIVVENTTTDKTYTAYKIFDATSSGTVAVSYTIDSSSVWYYTVSSATDVFTLTQAGQNSTTYYVTVNDGVEDADVIAVFASVPDGAVAAATGTGNGGSLTLNVGDAGYYYITTTTGSAVTITTTTGTITVVDKNQTPGGDLDKTVSDTEAQIGDSVTYTITSNVPAYDGETEITNYTFIDTLSPGLTAPAVSGVTVTIMNAAGNPVTVDENVITVTVENNVITVSYDPNDISGYPADATIKIEYTATVNAQAAYENGNSVTQTWTGNSDGKTETETVRTYGFNLQKVDGTDKTTQLTGAEFKLYTSETGGEALKFTKTTDTSGNVTYTVDPDGNETTIEAGYATIFGLDTDVTYYLEETKAPAGYNVLKDRVAVTISTTGTSEVDGVVTISQTEKVENNSGTSLPGTGGIGTTIFYVVGTVMVLGAVVVLITRKRMSA